MNAYKYRFGDSSTFERDLYSLENDYFWAPTRHDLNDPCEGLYGEDNLNHQLNMMVELFGKKYQK